MAATLIVRRDSDRDIKMREMEVHVDGEYAATVNYGRMYKVSLDPGEHTVMVTNKISKKEERFVVADGETATFLGANVLLGGLSFALGALGVIPYKVTLERA